MAGDRRKTTSQFDQMLADSARQFARLTGAPAVTSPARPVEAATARPTISSSRKPEVRPPADVTEQIVARFGTGWRHELLDSGRDGDAVRVSVRLILDSGVHSTAQAGSARIGGALVDDTAISGSANGIAFRFSATGSTGAMAVAGEQAALREAIGSALIKCLHTL